MKNYVLTVVLIMILSFAVYQSYPGGALAQGSITVEASTIIVVPPQTATPDNNTGGQGSPSGLTPTPDDPVIIQTTPNPTPGGPYVDEDDTIIKVRMIGCPGVGGATVVFERDGATTTAEISVDTFTVLDVPFGGEWTATINGEFVGMVASNEQPMTIQAGSILCPPTVEVLATPAFVPDTGDQSSDFTLAFLGILSIIGLVVAGVRNKYYGNRE